MLNLLVPLVAGTLLGYLLRNRRRFDIGSVTFWVIITLIFSLGFSIGSSNELLSSLPRVGLNAVVILFLAVLFSVVFVKSARKVVKMT